jgi:hypothetical protein
MDASKVPAKKESRLDKLVLIDSPNERFILNIEPQGYLDYKMPARMLRYRADIWEYTMEIKLGTPSIKQAVVYFFKDHDNEEYTLIDKWGDEETLKFSYKPIKLWEMKKEEVISKKLESLYPLLPLMKAEEDETKEEVLKQTIEKISTIKDDVVKADFMTIMSILAGQKFSIEFVKRFVRREMLMQSELLNEWIREELAERETQLAKEVAEREAQLAKEAAEREARLAKEVAEREARLAKEVAQRATLEKTRKNIIELLVERFDFVPKGIRESISAINDESMLDEIFKRAIRINNIDDFRELLEKIL